MKRQTSEKLITAARRLASECERALKVGLANGADRDVLRAKVEATFEAIQLCENANERNRRTRRMRCRTCGDDGGCPTCDPTGIRGLRSDIRRDAADNH